MDKNIIKKALEEVGKQPKKKFAQSYDVIINLKNINIKQTPLDFFVTLHYNTGVKPKVCAFVDQQLFDQASKTCDLVVKDTEFMNYADKKVAKKLAQDYDYFIAQSTIMPKVAAAFGKALGTRGKMPNPKLGCVVPPNANLDALVKRLGVTVHLAAKKGTNLQGRVGKESQSADEVVDNVLTTYQTAIKQLPGESQNIKAVLLKSTMGKPVRI